MRRSTWRTAWTTLPAGPERDRLAADAAARSAEVDGFRQQLGRVDQELHVLSGREDHPERWLERHGEEVADALADVSSSSTSARSPRRRRSSRPASKPPQRRRPASRSTSASPSSAAPEARAWTSTDRRELAFCQASSFAFCAANSSSVRMPCSFSAASSLSCSIGSAAGAAGAARGGAAQGRRALAGLLLCPAFALATAHAVGDGGRGAGDDGGSGGIPRSSPGMGWSFL